MDWSLLVKALALGVIGFFIANSLYGAFLSIETNSSGETVLASTNCTETYKNVPVCRFISNNSNLHGFFDPEEQRLYLNATLNDEGQTLRHEYCHYNQFKRGVTRVGFWEEFECYVAQLD